MLFCLPLIHFEYLVVRYLFFLLQEIEILTWLHKRKVHLLRRCQPSLLLNPFLFLFQEVISFRRLYLILRRIIVYQLRLRCVVSFFQRLVLFIFIFPLLLKYLVLLRLNGWQITLSVLVQILISIQSLRLLGVVVLLQFRGLLLLLFIHLSLFSVFTLFQRIIDTLVSVPLIFLHLLGLFLKDGL